MIVATLQVSQEKSSSVCFGIAQLCKVQYYAEVSAAASVIRKGWNLSFAAQGDLQQAIEDYHKALGLRPEDTFIAEMLAVALQDEAVPEELEGDDVFG